MRIADDAEITAVSAVRRKNTINKEAKPARMLKVSGSARSPNFASIGPNKSCLLALPSFFWGTLVLGVFDSEHLSFIHGRKNLMPLRPFAYGGDGTASILSTFHEKLAAEIKLLNPTNMPTFIGLSPDVR